MKNFDNASEYNLEQAETYVTMELLKRGFRPVILYNGDDMCEIEIYNESDDLVLTMSGVDYVDAIVNVGAHLYGVN